MTIRGIEGISADQVRFELQRGGRFVLYYYCVSVLVMTFRRPTDVYLIRAGENAVAKGIAVDPAHFAGRVVGNSLGSDLHHSITGRKPQGRQRRHCVACGPTWPERTTKHGRNREVIRLIMR